MFDLVFQNSTKNKKYNSKFFEKILNAGIEELKLDQKKVGISINLVGEGKIKELNKKYRHKNKVTDVLSFPMDDKYTIHNTQYTIHDLGDIFICLSFAKKEAKSENVSIERKLAHLTVHGFLHLLGYDHEKSTSEAKIMFNLENQILNKVGDL
ncbi:MAG: rRNA maturation RNase YbeY [Candidatus Taylorbacteria bacterium]|nr:rRNA maturation RNase YbeY [Candidatus Taylorbacteria bacterium]